MAGKGKSKLDNVKFHFKKRMLQRFGIVVNRDMIIEMKRQIRQGEAKFLFRNSLTRSCFKVNISGQDVAVVYHKKYRTFVTAIPLEWAEKTKLFLEDCYD